jgi:hypothetical protein
VLIQFGLYFLMAGSVWGLGVHLWLLGSHIGNGPLSGSQGHRQEVEMDGEERRAVMQNSWEL